MSLNKNSTTETAIQIADKQIKSNESEYLTAVQGFIKQVLNRDILAATYYAYRGGR